MAEHSSTKPRAPLRSRPHTRASKLSSRVSRGANRADESSLAAKLPAPATKASNSAAPLRAAGCPRNTPTRIAHTRARPWQARPATVGQPKSAARMPSAWANTKAGSPNRKPITPGTGSPECTRPMRPDGPQNREFRLAAALLQLSDLPLRRRCLEALEISVENFYGFIELLHFQRKALKNSSVCRLRSVLWGQSRVVRTQAHQDQSDSVEHPSGHLFAESAEFWLKHPRRRRAALLGNPTAPQPRPDPFERIGYTGFFRRGVSGRQICSAPLFHTHLRSPSGPAHPERVHTVSVLVAILVPALRKRPKGPNYLF